MVDVAKSCLEFIVDESCGKCTPCREGTRQMYRIMNRFCEGRGREGDIERLKSLRGVIQLTPLGGLGQNAPNPALSTMQFFEDEYLPTPRARSARRTSASICLPTARTRTSVSAVRRGARQCPVQAVAGEVKMGHTIDACKCVKCGSCYEVCRFGAILRE